LAEATSRREQARNLVGGLEHGPARWLRRRGLAQARQQYERAEEAYQVARQQADRAVDRERQARRAQQQHQAHREAHPDLAVELERPEWSRDLGQRPATVKGGRAWDRAVEQTVEYRQRWKVTDPGRALGPEPHGTDACLEQRRAWRHATRAVGRLRDLVGDRTERADRVDATGRHLGDHRRDRERPAQFDREHAMGM
jgi:hypothetical protein